MILQALTEHYEALAKQTTQRQITPRGWTYAKISFALCINDAGELERVIPLMPNQTQGKMAGMRWQEILLPIEPSGRTGGAQRPSFLWDSSKYFFGITSEQNEQKELVTLQKEKHFESSRELHHRLLDKVDIPAAKALLAFFDHWIPANAVEHPALQQDWKEITSKANLVFRYDGGYVHDDPLIRQAWQDQYDDEDNDPTMICLVTGKPGPVARIHPRIKNLIGGNTSGTYLVSFNEKAFCSYGHEQSLNAPVSKQAAFAYTAALNYMIADRAHVQHLGDTTVLFWARSGQSDYQDFFSGFAFGSDVTYDEGDLANMLKNLLQGHPVQYSETLLDPNMDFYILGLSPNAARLSVRFFLRNSFGGFLTNVQRHHKRLDIVRPSFDKHETISLKALLDATVNQHSRDKVPSSVMTGEVMRAILADTRYPASLLNGVTLRIRAEHEIDRTRAAILKAYYLKNPHPDVPKEVLTVSLNSECTTPAYVLGRLFSVYETIQADANKGIKATIKDKYFNTAASTPATIFPILGNLAQKHLKKLKSDKPGLCVNYEKEIAEITALLGESFPVRMSLPQQGAFQLGYYHQTQYHYLTKEDKENV